MNKKMIIQMSLFILLASLLAGCAGAPMASAFAPTAAPTTAEVESAPAPTALPTLKPRPTATATPDEAELAARSAEAAAQAYFAALEAGDAQAAADLVSSFSLMVFEMTRGDAAAALQAQKAGWSDLEVGEVEPFDEKTMLVSVKYTAQGEEGPEAREEVWALRNESGAWKVNWDRLIDFRTLTVDPQTTNGVTVLPVQMLRFTDRLRLEMLVQNRTSQPVVFGQANEVLATFHVGAEDVVAEKTQVVFNPLRSAHGVPLEIKGLYEAYPDAVTIRQWKSYNVQPWYEFDLTR